jgi:hypothetical protein
MLSRTAAQIGDLVFGELKPSGEGGRREFPGQDWTQESRVLMEYKRGITLILGDYFGILFWTMVLETQLTALHFRFLTKSYLLLRTSLLLASADNI